ncbi:MAG TPA: archaellin/type IV pilin N-terminal domain-containing protein [Candidatus Thermoplasmatota archaeon]|nr:archaellin/type IV pilin N-terminal domain-containing protein [Candidatus Thermoplasmatota archaeon]
MSLSRITGAYRREIARNDAAISPIIATILLIAATVVLGATIYAATTGFGSKTPTAGTDASFTAKPFDSDGNGLSDTIRITYLQGPPGLDVTMIVADDTGTTITHGCDDTDLAVGDSCIVDETEVDDGRWTITITAGNAVILDQTVTIEQP